MPPNSSNSPYLAEGCITPYPRSELVRQRLWSIIQATLFRFSLPRAHRFRAELLRWFGADIPAPAEVVIFASVQIFFPWKLRLESRAMVGRDVTIYNLGPVTLQRGANVSQRCHLCSGSHDYNQWSMPLITAPIVIETNAWLAAEVFVGPGVTIGELAVVGARSVVVHDQPARMVCAGHPCRPVKPRAEPV